MRHLGLLITVLLGWIPSLRAQTADLTQQLANTARASTSLVLNGDERIQVGASFVKLIGIRGPSGKEAEIRDHLAELLAPFSARRMKLNNSHSNAPLNLAVEIPATTGFEKHPAILLNAHIDIIPESKSDKMRFDPKTGDFYHQDESQVNVKSSFGGDDRAGVVAMVEAIRNLHTRFWSQGIGHRRIVLLFTAQEEVGMRGAKYLNRFEPQVFSDVEISLAIDGPIDLKSRYPTHSFIAVLSPSDVAREPYQQALGHLTEFCKATGKEFGTTRLGLGFGDFAYFPEKAKAGMHLRSPVRGWHTRERVKLQDLINHVDLLVYFVLAWDHPSPQELIRK